MILPFVFALYVLFSSFSNSLNSSLHFYLHAIAEPITREGFGFFSKIRTISISVLQNQVVGLSIAEVNKNVLQFYVKAVPWLRRKKSVEQNFYVPESRVSLNHIEVCTF